MKSITLRPLSSLPVLCFVLSGVSAFAGTINVQWIGTVQPYLWSTAAGWSGGVVPNNSGGNSYNVTLLVRGAPVTADISPNISSLMVGRGSWLIGGTGQTLTTGSLDNDADIQLGISNQGLPAPNSTLNVSGNLNNRDFGDINLSNSARLTVGGTLSNTGGVFVGNNISPAQLNAQHYIQTARLSGPGGSFTAIYTGSTMSMTDAVISGGTLFLGGGTMNGDLSMEGGTYATGGFLPYGFVCGCSSILNGNFSATSSSTYSESILSGVQGSAPGPLAVSGDADLAGTLDLNFCNFYGCVSFPDGATINLMSYAAETGQFNSIEWAGLYPNQTVTLNYGPHELDAIVHGRPLPEPSSFFLMGAGLLAMAFGLRRKLALYSSGT
jgi:hypothetical protein